MFCGEPRTGIHKYRILDIAIVDLSLTILISFIISYFSKHNVLLVFIVFIQLSIIIHSILGIKTQTNYFLYTLLNK